MKRKNQKAEKPLGQDSNLTEQKHADVFNRNLNNARKAQAILSVAAREFVEKGYSQTSVADIADKLNISKPTLYYYVGNKEEILFKCQQTALDQLKDVLAEVLDKDLDGIDTLQQFMIRMGEWIGSEFARCIARCHLDLLHPEAKEEILAGRRELDRAVRDIIKRGIRDGSIRPCNPQSTGAALFGAFNWMAHWYDPKHTSKSTKKIGEEFMSVFIQGLGIS